MQMKRKPKFGQNFLVDDAARHAIVAALGDIGKRIVIEIGPGHGAITEILAGRCRRLIALELDRALADFAISRRYRLSKATFSESTFERSCPAAKPLM
jgi:16S rRNA A1518/A1519 N6-dimethyltransferase RsmA/KsgA/DIM1 with predicted DNA glycosylase/AP lyase activity